MTRTNGKPARRGFAAAIADRLGRSDRVAIGPPDYTPDDSPDAASFADVAKVVGSVKWLIRNWLPQGMLTGVIAEPKAGKSAFALGALAAPVLLGTRWFNQSAGPDPGAVMFVDTERSAAVNVKRATDWGLPLDRIKVPFPDDPLRPLSLEAPEHIARLREVVCRHKARLVIVDSFRGAHDGDENNSRIVRPLRELGGVAEETGAAVVLIHHAKKMNVDEDLTINAGRGSNAFLAAVRCQIAVDRPDPKSDWRRAQVLGENLGIAPPAIGFRITEIGLEFGPAPVRPARSGEQASAASWLQRRMRPGTAYPSAELIAEAEQCGIKERTLRKAATETLGVKPRQVRAGGKVTGWTWTLPAENA